MVPGIAGDRYTPAEVAQSLGVLPETVRAWIERGWLRASLTSYGYRIRHKAVRRALRDIPEVARTVVRGLERRQLEACNKADEVSEEGAK